MTQDNILKRIGLHMREHSYFGIASLLLGLDAALAFFLLLLTLSTSWGEALIESFPSLLVDPALSGNLIIVGVPIGLVGLLIDRKKVFSILGLALFLISVILSFIYVSLTP